MQSVKYFIIMVITMSIVKEGKAESQQFDSVVALDGSGNFTKVSEAVSAAPNNSTRKYYIRIKRGIYVERVHVGRKKTNIAFIGDGKDVTIITYNRSNATGYVSRESATLDIEGDGFIAKHITINNSAGPTNGQAVAMRSTSNFAAFYDCNFHSYQDTLLLEKGIQFYRDTQISGTIDIIFGDATVVLQNCVVLVHNPGEGQSNVITAQGRVSLKDMTGISMHNCSIIAAEDFNLKSGVKTYLGRPWKQFARVVVMQSFLGNIIDPKGWLQWGSGNFINTVYYGEYGNRGPGASTGGRVKWKGFRVMSKYEAKEFTVRKFIAGDRWLPSTNIPFEPDFISLR